MSRIPLLRFPSLRPPSPWHFLGLFVSASWLPEPKRIGLEALGISDVSCSERELSINLRKSKTDQARKGVKEVLLPLGDPRYCPVTRVGEFLVLRPATQGYLLIHANRSPLTKYQFERVMAACLARAGLLQADKRYSSHSFRIGAATSAFKAGMGMENVKKVGRWDSQSFKLYIRPRLHINVTKV